MFRKYINDNIITKTPCLVDISLGIVTITSPLAVHIGLPMLVTAYILGTIVTRMCAVLHAIKL